MRGKASGPIDVTGAEKVDPLLIRPPYKSKDVAAVIEELLSAARVIRGSTAVVDYDSTAAALKLILALDFFGVVIFNSIAFNRPIICALWALITLCLFAIFCIDR